MIETVADEKPDTARRSPAPVLLSPLAVEAIAARIGSGGARVEHIGMGADNAARAAGRLVEALPPSARCAVVGFAAGLSRKDRAGDVIVASELVADGRTQAPQILDTALRDGLVAALSQRVRVRSGRVVSCRRVVAARELEGLGASTGALACDTESAFMTELGERGPFAVVRVLVDRPGRPLVGPWTIPAGLVAFARLVSACRVVADVLEQFEDSP